MFLRESVEEVAAPGICALCMGSELPMVDTLRQNPVPGAHPLRGKQYVCSVCIRTLAEFAGLLDEAADVAKLQRQVSYWKRKALSEADLATNLRKLLEQAEDDEPEPTDEG